MHTAYTITCSYTVHWQFTAKTTTNISVNH